MPRNLYPDESSYKGAEEHIFGIVLANLGTPDAPTPAALRRYLAEFLSDPRVVEQPRWSWWPILHLFVLPFRPRRSAELYRKIWTDEGSPLLLHSWKLNDAVAARLGEDLQVQIEVTVGMRYGTPSIAEALRRLRDRGCTRILCLPLFPQYSASTGGSVFDAVAAELSGWRRVPELRMVLDYHDDPAYVAALAASIRDGWVGFEPPERLLFSFHGIPERYAAAGDPYREQCEATFRAVVEALDFDPERCVMAYQSQFGRERWIGPATAATLQQMARSGIRSVDVLCPGFAVDCLETLEEIAQLNRDFFLSAGGERYRYLPCLNDRPDHVAALADLLARNLGGWF